MIRNGSTPLWKPGIGAQIDRSHPAAKGLLACWLFNENSGAVSYDMMGQYHYAFTGGVSRMATPTGPAIKFNGIGGQGIAQGHPLANAAAFTVILYVNQKDGLGNPFGPYLGSEQSSTGGCYIGSDQIGAMIYEIGNVNNSLAVNDGQWNHCAFQYNGTTKAAFLNGILSHSVSNTFGVMPNYLNTYIGKRPVSDGGYTTDSQIGYMKVWNRILSQSEIVGDYTSPWAMFTPANDRRFLRVASSAPGGGLSVGSLAIGGSGRLSVGIV